MREVSHTLFESAFNDVKDTLKYKEFVGYKEGGFIDCTCYLNEDANGFAITKDEKELVNLFSTKSGLLIDPEVVEIINKEADFLVCLGYMDFKFGSEHAVPTSIANYYNLTLGFTYYGKSISNTLDEMIAAKGMDFAAGFVKKYGIPFQMFLVNPKYNLDFVGNKFNYTQLKTMLLQDLAKKKKLGDKNEKRR